MSSLQVDNIQTYNSNPPVIKNVSGTEVGKFCRAWVNFNGTGVIAIRSSFNVSSITDNGTGYYTLNFTSALVDANYCAVGISMGSGTGPGFTYTVSTFNTSAGTCNVSTNNIYYQQFEDLAVVNVAIFR